ncbi:cysteine--tRNA ligase [Chloroflexota bacterium]
MKVYNTLSGKKEEFLPEGSEVNMYVCGVTPYSDAHIGHALSQVIFDVIRRCLQFRDYKVKYVQNVTDIDDKIIDRANKLGISTRELAEKYANSYFEDMAALNVNKPDIQPYATEEIPKMIEVIQGLVDKGYAYPSQGSVYFRVSKVPDYGKLSHRALESMMAGESSVGGDDKESPMDFVLWKASKPGEPSWESPWGPGRPGWHIECSAMSLKYLGNTLDIHGGGQDLIFPHHENEIAQSESFTGKPFVKYWLHNGMVQFGAEKMSKSLGNLITIKEALSKYSADAIRLFILNSHYRSPLTYSEELLEAAEKRAERLAHAYSRSSSGESTKSPLPMQVIKACEEQFFAAMDDDFNTARALARVSELAAVINRATDSGRDTEDAKHLLRKLASDILGLTLKPPERPALETDYFVDLQESILTQLRKEKLEKVIEKIAPLFIQMDVGEKDAETYINLLRDVRDILRNDKYFKLADKIRNRLEELGIVLEDTPRGTEWKYKR